jgi:nucleoside-diphosphate-sugar epimerase
MTYMVTGGTGFIGSWVVKAILEAGHDVVCFELMPNQTRLDALLGEDVARVKVIHGDVLHLHKIIEAVGEHGVTHIAHIAAAVMAVCTVNPPYAMQVNVIGFTNMLEACRITGIKRMAWASSAGIFGGSYSRDVPIANDARPSPPTIYAASKVMGEALAVHYHDNYGVDAIGLRYTFVNGHGMPNSMGGKVLDELCRKPAVGQAGVVPWGDDSPDWLWAGDAGRATALTLDGPPTKTRAFNIKGDNHPMKDAMDCVRSILPDAKLTAEPGALGFNKLDGSAAEAEFGYKPEWTMQRQMRAHIDRAREDAGLPPL